MSSHRRRTLLRSAAVTTAVGGALLMPAVAAVADSPAHAEAAHTEAAQADGTRTVAPVAPGAPEGGVKAGTEGFHSGDPVFIAAGGAMAAAGAAGLGYAMLRRGRTDA
ncbi:hypothetical protein ACWGH2_23000 [Streptomyces sp. NPDC054871]